MQITIVAVGTKMPQWVDTGFAEYAKRMPADMRVLLREIRPETRSSSRTISSALSLEADRIRLAVPRRGAIAVLDERGADITSVDLAQRLQRWHDLNEDVCFLIGSADGLDPSLKSQANLTLRLSSMTLPHGLARVLLAEQLYRAASILQNHPYHRS